MTGGGARRALALWRARRRQLAAHWTTWQGEWSAERELERIVAGDGPIIAGPWLSEVGYEVLYWVPFLRWVAAAYRIPPGRLVALSRGGTESWYRGVAGRYVEVFDHVAPGELAARAAAGQLKQREATPLDQRLIEQAAAALDLRDAHVLHPSLLFRWFAPFWSGHESLGFVERHTRHARIAAPEATVPIALPPEYVAVKLYGARALPDEPAVRAQLRSLVSGLSERWPVVQLDTNLGVDEHADYSFGGSHRVLSVSGQLDPRTNLAVQTRIIAGARLFVGTCGSLAWLAPLLGVDTIPVFTDAGFLHAHLHVARRAYGRLGAGRFAPVDLSGLMDAGLAVGGAERLLSTASAS
jgi:hypothetical protein